MDDLVTYTRQSCIFLVCAPCTRGEWIVIVGRRTDSVEPGPGRSTARKSIRATGRRGLQEWTGTDRPTTHGVRPPAV